MLDEENTSSLQQGSEALMCRELCVCSASLDWKLKRSTDANNWKCHVAKGLSNPQDVKFVYWGKILFENFALLLSMFIDD